LVIPTYLAVCTCRNSVHHHRCDRALRDLSRTADLCPLQFNPLLRPMSNEPQKIGQNLGIARPRIAFHELCCAPVELFPKFLLRSVERAYLRRRQPWEEATTIKTLVPGLSPLWYRRSNCPAMAGAPGVWSYDSGPMRSDLHTKIDRGIVQYLA
jgi:hypothetical protein